MQLWSNYDSIIHQDGDIEKISFIHLQQHKQSGEKLLEFYAIIEDP